MANTSKKSVGSRSKSRVGNKKFSPFSRWRSPLRMANFMLLFALVGVVFLYLTNAYTVAGMYGSAENDQLTKTNNQRALIGRSALQHIECLNGIAETWAKKMSDTGKLAHSNDTKSGIYSTSTDFSIQTPAKCGGTWSLLGENVGVGGDSASIFNAFMASTAHKNNIEDSRFTKVGMGAYWSGSQLWVTQIFASCSSCTSEWTKTATVAVDPVAPFTCSKVSNLTPSVDLTNLTQPAAPGDTSTIQTVTTSTEIRDYYYRSAGTRYTVAFTNHTITSISPNAPVVSSSHIHPNGNSTASGQHQVKLDYTPLFKSNPNTTYTPKITYKYTWNFTQSLWVKRYAKTSSGTRGALLYPAAESNGDGTGGTVTDALTKVVPLSPTGTKNGPTLGPCN